MRSLTRPCSFPSCGNHTTKNSGRCHHHERLSTGQYREIGFPVPTKPPIPGEAWKPGEVHPTGGYDQIETRNGGDDFYFRREGMKHRADGPAMVRLDSDGAVVEQEWWVDGEMHREGAPASIRRYPGGSIETYVVHDVTHRDGGPAVIRYDADGRVREETYRKNGDAHREDGPGFIRYDVDGMVIEKIWARNGGRHRTDGPAVITYDRLHGEKGFHWLYGKPVSEEEFTRYREAIDSGAPDEWALAYAEGSSE